MYALTDDTCRDSNERKSLLACTENKYSCFQIQQYQAF